MGNLQSERIFSENHRNSSSSQQSPWGGTSESTGHLKDRCWAHHSRSGPKGNSHKQKRRRSWSYIYHCGRNNNLLLCWKWAAPSRGWNSTVPHKGKLAPMTDNQWIRCTGFAVLVFFICCLLGFIIVWSRRRWWKTAPWAGHSLLWGTPLLVGQKGIYKRNQIRKFNRNSHGLRRESGCTHH